MQNEIYMIQQSGGSYPEDSYTLSLFFVTSEDEAKRLVALAGKEWSQAMEQFPYPERMAEHDMQSWTDEKWDQYHQDYEDAVTAVIEKRRSILTVDPKAPVYDDDDKPTYSYRILETHEAYLKRVTADVSSV